MVTDDEWEKLVQQLSSGNERTVNEAALALREQSKAMVAVIVKFKNGTKEEFDTVLNDTITSVIRILQKGRYEKERANLTTLIYTIAKHKWLTILKDRHKNGSILVPIHHLPEHPLAHRKNPIEINLFSQEEKERIRWAIRQLNPKDRMLIEKKYLEGVSLRVIAEQLAISEDAVKKRHERCKQKLKEILGKDPRLED